MCWLLPEGSAASKENGALLAFLRSLSFADIRHDPCLLDSDRGWAPWPRVGRGLGCCELPGLWEDFFYGFSTSARAAIWETITLMIWN